MVSTSQVNRPPSGSNPPDAQPGAGTGPTRVGQNPRRGGPGPTGDPTRRLADAPPQPEGRALNETGPFAKLYAKSKPAGQIDGELNKPFSQIAQDGRDRSQEARDRMQNFKPGEARGRYADREASRTRIEDQRPALNRDKTRLEDRLAVMGGGGTSENGGTSAAGESLVAHRESLRTHRGRGQGSGGE